ALSPARWNPPDGRGRRHCIGNSVPGHEAAAHQVGGVGYLGKSLTVSRPSLSATGTVTPGSIELYTWRMRKASECSTSGLTIRQTLHRVVRLRRLGKARKSQRPSPFQEPLWRLPPLRQVGCR